MANIKYIELNSDKTPKTDYDTFKFTTNQFENAGRILNGNTIVVDFDNHKEIAELIINLVPTRAIKTTRGYHLYYKVPPKLQPKNTNGTITVLGCPVDYKTGYGGKKQYAIVKMNGINREIINDIEDYPLLPKILYPTKSKIDLIDLQKGNRNETIYKHLMNVVDEYDFSIDECLTLSENIISVMKYPLEKTEMQNIVQSVYKSRSMSDVNDNFFINTPKGQKLDIFLLAEYLKKRLNCIYYGHNLYFKIDGSYTCNVVKLQTYIYNNLNLKLQKKDDTELYHQLCKTDNITEKDNLPIVFNKKYMLKNNRMQEYTGEFSPFMLDVDYDFDCYDEYVDNFLNWCSCNHGEIRKLLEEVLGHCLMINHYPQNAFFLISDKGANGKSTFLEMVNNFFGDLASNLALEEMKEDKNLGVLVGKLVNCGDDISDSLIKDSRLFKTLVGGNTISVRQLYQNAYSHKNTASMIFSLNEMPTFRDKTGGIKRRLILIPFDNKIENDDIDLDINNKLSTPQAKSYILNLALKGLNRILENKCITVPKKSLDIIKQYDFSTNSILQFIEYYKNMLLKEFDGATISSVYMSYVNFCDTENLKAFSKIKFSRYLRDNLGLDSKLLKINNIAQKVYYYKGE